MRTTKFSKRDVLKGATALAVGSLFAEPLPRRRLRPRR